MKKILIGAVAVSALCGTAAVASDDTRITALEKENAAIRKENVLLRENKALRKQNAGLKSANPPMQLTDAQQPAAQMVPGAARSEAVPLVEPKSSDPFGAYAADLPIAYKAAPLEQKGVFRVWGEGGAIWSGGDPVSSAFQLGDFTGLGIGLGGGGGGPAGVFDLTPKVGWEAATGFDYRFANSLWHVSGQFRYGEGGKTNGSASTSGSVDPAILLLLGAPPGVGFGGSEALNTSYTETHWLADLAVGRDVLGSGPDAMQVKAGLRISEFVARTRTSDITNIFVNGLGLVIPGFPFNNVNATTNSLTDARNTFLGAGPRVGIEGSVPFAGNWAFDYLGDAAILFGTQTVTTTQISNTSVTPALAALLFGGGNSSSVGSSRTYASVFNGDVQVGVSYWVTPHVKVSGSYRLDAYINVSNDIATSTTVNRYIHGPRLGVTAQF